MSIALDANAYSSMVVGDAAIAAIVAAAEEVWVPFIVLGELGAGFRCGKRRAENEAILRKFLNKPGVAVLWPDIQTVDHYASLYGQLRQQGTPVPTNDLWIAALAVQHQLTVASYDQHFRHLPQIEVVP